MSDAVLNRDATRDRLLCSAFFAEVVEPRARSLPSARSLRVKSPESFARATFGEYL